MTDLDIIRLLEKKLGLTFTEGKVTTDASSEFLKMYELNAEKQIVKLRISNSTLSYIPKEIGELMDLQTLDLQWNKIEKIEQLIQQDFNEDYTLEKNENEQPRNKVGIFHLGTGGGSTSKNDNYNYHMMAINSWDSLRVQSNGGFIDNLVDSLLFQCRQKK